MLETVESMISKGWVAVRETLTYVSVNSFSIAGDWTGVYQIGDKFRLTQTTVKYFRITAISYSSPNTTITVEAFNLYAVENATITDVYFSRFDTPFGFPLKEKLLFNGTPAANVTLSESSAYFDRLLVFYTQQGFTFSTFLNVAATIGQVAMAVQGYFDGAYKIRNGSAQITISGTSLYFHGAGENYSTDTTSASAVAFSDVKIVPQIVKVIGFRW